MMPDFEKIILIDGSSLLYRAYFALPHFITKDGEPTGAIYGFVQMLLRLIKDEKPDYVAVSFDRKAPTLRHIEFKEYKANRPPVPDELARQFETIHEVLAVFGIPVYEIDGYEADDVIATLVNLLKTSNMQILIVTGDMDLAQLIDGNVILVLTRKGVSNLEKLDRNAFQKKMGFSPERVVDYKILTGDVSDNIPGIPGIGPKRALKFIEKYENLEALLDNLDGVGLAAFKDQILLSRSLCTLVNNVPIKFNLEEAHLKDFKNEKVFNLLSRFEFKTIIKELNFDNLMFENTNANETTYDGSRVGIYIEVSTEGSLNFAYANENEAKEYRIGKDLFADRNALNTLASLLSREEVRKEVYDLKSLYRVAKKFDLTLSNIHLDVCLCAYLINPDIENYSLERLCKEFFVSAKLDTMTGRAKAVYELSRVEEPVLEREKLLNLYEQIEKPLSEVLFDMEEAGIKIDVAYFRELEKSIEANLSELEEKIYSLAGISFNILSSKQLSSILFESLGLTPSKSLKTGYSTSSEVLDEIVDQHPIVPLIQKYRHLAKLKSTYIEALPRLIAKEDGKLHTHFHQIGTSTGRLRSSDPNLQNIPMKGEWAEWIRKGFVSTDNEHALISADYSQIELRILAHLSKDSELVRAFENDEDIHAYTASMLFNVKVKDVTKEMRNRAKVINFGIIYGISPYGLSKQLMCSQEEAAAYIERYFERYSGVKTYIEGLVESAKKRGEARTITGRLRKIPGFESSNASVRENARRIAINSPIQGSAADIIKIAMVNLYRKTRNIDFHIILQIHDELVSEVHLTLLEEAKNIIKQEMESAYALIVPLRVNISSGMNLLEAKP